MNEIFTIRYIVFYDILILFVRCYSIQYSINTYIYNKCSKDIQAVTLTINKVAKHKNDPC